MINWPASLSNHLLPEFQIKCLGFPEFSRQKNSLNDRYSECHALFSPLVRNVRRCEGMFFRLCIAGGCQKDTHWETVNPRNVLKIPGKYGFIYLYDTRRRFYPAQDNGLLRTHAFFYRARLRDFVCHQHQEIFATEKSPGSLPDEYLDIPWYCDRSILFLPSYGFHREAVAKGILVFCQ